MSEALLGLLADVLGEVGIGVCAGVSRDVAPSLVLVGGDGREINQSVAVARSWSSAVPVIALLPVYDLTLAAEAMRNGVDGWHALDGPLSRLKDTVERALEARAAWRRS